MPITTPHIMVVDPGMKTPELDTFNLIASLAPLPCAYHLPGLFGFGSFPETFEGIKRVILLGSAANVEDNPAWQAPLIAWLRQVIERDIPLLAICYGHQLLGAMFRGTVTWATPERVKIKGARQIEILPNDCFPAGVRPLNVTHAQAVTSLPPDFALLARSDTIAIDGMRHRSKPVYSFQAHPESTEIFLKEHGMLEPATRAALPFGHELIRAFVSGGNRSTSR
jgi:GMP synthase (glutamine-hydrolysing)